MGENMKIKYAIVLIAVTLLTSCTRILSNPSDEIKLNNWKAELKNGYTVTLDFVGDNADLELNGDIKTSIKGLCVIDSEEMIIYGAEPYVFRYALSGDSLKLIRGKGKVTLLKN